MLDDTLLDDHPHEACGIFAAWAPGEDVARLTYFGLYALQHRGQESAGIASTDGWSLHMRAQLGLVAQAFDEPLLATLRGSASPAAIGHTRYSTMGSNRSCNVQPILVADAQPTRLGELALAHN